MLPTPPRFARRAHAADRPSLCRRFASLLILVSLLALLSSQPLYAQTGTTVRRDRHIDREVQIRYPRVRSTPEPNVGQSSRDGSRVWRAGPTSSAGYNGPSGPHAPVRPGPQ